jgi:hypothetical protein
MEPGAFSPFPDAQKAVSIYGHMVMEDRGDKIISLAREMLRSNVDIEPVTPPPSPSNAISFRVLCFATLLAAFGGGFVTAWDGEQHRPLNHYEKIELEALIFYASHSKGLDEAQLRKDLEAKLGIINFDDMDKAEFRRARLLLQQKAS